jgi:acetolactate decarboxylase
MAEGKTGPTVKLADVPSPHLYALGALSELRGEVLILDDRKVASYPARQGVRVEQDASAERATLLVAAQVPAWRRLPIAADISSADFDARIGAMAAAAGMDVTKPFPFLIEGRFHDVAWHVLDGESLPPTASHDDRMSAARRGALPSAEGFALGFYSTAHVGIFTHMGRRTHVHGLFPSNGIMGHCDDLGVAAGSVLLLPTQQR